MAPLSTTVVAAILVAGMLPLLVTSSPVEKRGGAEFFDKVEFYRKYKLQMDEYCLDKYPAFQYPDACRLATDNSTWTAMTYSHNGISPAEYLWEADDATTASCLITLHHKQKTKCISVRGSECEANAGTSKILNARLFEESDGRLTVEDSAALQAASRALVGAKVNSIAPNPERKIPSGVYLAHLNRAKVDVYNQPDPDLELLSIVFGGADQC